MNDIIAIAIHNSNQVNKFEIFFKLITKEVIIRCIKSKPTQKTI
jgi:hypothetical protein